MTVEELTRLAEAIRTAARLATDPVLACRLDAGAWAVDRLIEQAEVGSRHRLGTDR